jgi:hypothetical protein
MPKTDIQKSIEDTISQIVHLKVVENQLDQTKIELDSHYQKLESMNNSMAKELRDIEKLEGFSTTAIFHKILGSKEAQLEKERQEYLELTLKHEDIQKTIQILEYEVNLLEAKITSKESLEIELEKLKGLRESEIIKSDPILRKTLLELSQNLEEKYHFKKELQEALEAGSICQNLLKQISDHLNRVRNWGGFHHQKRGQLERMQRRDAIDRARNLSYQVRHHLQLFDRELKDIGHQLNHGIDTAQFSEFTDFFFNNIITDWILQQKLTKAIGSVQMTYKEVLSILNYIDQTLIQTQETIDSLKERRENILMN